MLDEAPEPGAMVVAELERVETANGELVDVAGFQQATRAVAALELGREPTGVPLFVYTSEPTRGSA